MHKLFAGLALSFALANPAADALASPRTPAPLASGETAPGAPAGIMSASSRNHGEHGSAAIVAGALEISSFWARAMLPGQPTGGAYLTIVSKGDADRLVSASSPAAGKVEIHNMTMNGEVMVMRPVEGGLEIPAGGTVELKPGGLHLMFLSPSEPFREGGTVPLTLRFEKAGTVEIELPVRPAGGHGDH